MAAGTIDFTCPMSVSPPVDGYTVSNNDLLLLTSTKQEVITASKR